MTPAVHRHLPDERLIACSLVEAQVDGRTPAEAAAFAHLALCPACARRYEELARTLEAVREADRAEADALFSPEHLEDQRAHLLRRLEALGRPARVLPFPGRRVPAGTDIRPALRPARWAAVAAAAGLIVGLSLGWFMEVRFPHFSNAPAPAVSTARPAPTLQPAPDSRTDGDEELLSNIVDALSNQRAAELEALDAFTPRVRDVAVVLR